MLRYFCVFLTRAGLVVCFFNNSKKFCFVKGKPQVEWIILRLKEKHNKIRNILLLFISFFNLNFALMMVLSSCLYLQHDTQADWRTNGAGFHHSHMYGFGLLNAWRLVNAAKVESSLLTALARSDEWRSSLCLYVWQVWESVPFLVSYQSPVLKANEIIPANPKTLTHTWNGKRFIFRINNRTQHEKHVTFHPEIRRTNKGVTYIKNKKNEYIFIISVLKCKYLLCLDQ